MTAKMSGVDLNDKRIVVFGAGGLIGVEIVAGLLASGARVSAVDVDSARLSSLVSQVENQSDALHHQIASITDADGIAKALDTVADRWGGVDAAVNLAYPRNKAYGNHFFDVTYADFAENVSLHLGGYFVVMQQCAKYALDRHTAFSLVQFASIYGIMAPRFDVYQDTSMTTPVEYAAVKSALIHLTRYVTAYTQGSKFRVNCISPGGILDQQPAAFLERYHAHTRGKGMLDSRDVLGTVLYLCSDLSEFVCGQNIIVDDGFSN